MKFKDTRVWKNEDHYLRYYPCVNAAGCISLYFWREKSSCDEVFIHGNA